MNPVSPIAAGSDIAAMLSGNDNAPRDTDSGSGDQFASALQAASEPRRPVERRTDKGEAKAVEAKAVETKAVESTKTTDVEAPTDADIEDAVVLAVTPNVVPVGVTLDAPVKPEVLSTGITAGDAFISELNSVIATATAILEAKATPAAPVATQPVPAPAAVTAEAITAPSNVPLAPVPVAPAPVAPMTTAATAPPTAEVAGEIAPAAGMSLDQMLGEPAVAPTVATPVAPSNATVVASVPVTNTSTPVVPQEQPVAATVTAPAVPTAPVVVSDPTVGAPNKPLAPTAPLSPAIAPEPAVKLGEVGQMPVAAELVNIEKSAPEIAVVPTKAEAIPTQAFSVPVVNVANAPSDISAVKTPGMPMPMEPFKQVVQFISPLLNRGNGDYTMNMMLHPEELGSVAVQVSLTNGVINMMMSSDNAGARQALQDSMKDLRSSLENSGLTTGSLDVGADNRNDGSKNPTNSNGSSNVQHLLADEDQSQLMGRLANIGFTTSSATAAGDGPLDVRV